MSILPSLTTIFLGVAIVSLPDRAQTGAGIVKESSLSDDNHHWFRDETPPPSSIVDFGGKATTDSGVKTSNSDESPNGLVPPSPKASGVSSYPAEPVELTPQQTYRSQAPAQLTPNWPSEAPAYTNYEENSRASQPYQLPSAPRHIAYYSPNQPQQTQSQIQSSSWSGYAGNSAGAKRPPLFLIGNFPGQSHQQSYQQQPPPNINTIPYVPPPAATRPPIDYLSYQAVLPSSSYQQPGPLVTQARPVEYISSPPPPLSSISPLHTTVPSTVTPQPTKQQSPKTDIAAKTTTPGYENGGKNSSPLYPQPTAPTAIPHPPSQQPPTSIEVESQLPYTTTTRYHLLGQPKRQEETGNAAIAGKRYLTATSPHDNSGTVPYIPGKSTPISPRPAFLSPPTQDRRRTTPSRLPGKPTSTPSPATVDYTPATATPHIQSPSSSTLSPPAPFPSPTPSLIFSPIPSPPAMMPPAVPSPPAPPRSEFSPPPIRPPEYIPGRPYQPPAPPPLAAPPSPRPPPAQRVYNIPPHGVLRPPIHNSGQYQSPQAQTVAPIEKVSNRIRGKARVVCEEDGISFAIDTILPFSGQIFTHDKKRTPSCVHNFKESQSVTASFSYAECGTSVSGAQPTSLSSAQYRIEILVMFEQAGGRTSLQSFMIQCEQQKVPSIKQESSPKRIEEALEELRLVPSVVEQKAPIPEAHMKILTDVEHHKAGDGVETAEVNMGQSLRLEFSLQPPSDAYGFHVRNCIVKDTISGAQHEVIDAKGCSMDSNIFSHPHYDTYLDVARVHWHAFKLPDHSRLSVQCHFEVCTDISDSAASANDGMSSCSQIPTVWRRSFALAIPKRRHCVKPPFCPDTVTSAPDSTLGEAPPHGDQTGYLRKRSVRVVAVPTGRADGNQTTELLMRPADSGKPGTATNTTTNTSIASMTQSVHADICLSQQSSPTIPQSSVPITNQCRSPNGPPSAENSRWTQTADPSTNKLCGSRSLVGVATALCFAILVLSIISNLTVVVFWSFWRRCKFRTGPPGAANRQIQSQIPTSRRSSPGREQLRFAPQRPYPQAN